MTGRLRIVAGSYGGRLISCPDACARPTTDRVREAAFSTITSIVGSLEGLTACDAFAGSGALGFEALSRGAKSAVLFDADGRALACIKENARALGCEEATQICRRDVLTAGITSPHAPYDLLFMDPPYATQAEDVAMLITRASADGALSPGCLIFYEHASDALSLPDMPGIALIKQKRYGKTAVDHLQCS